MENFLPFFLVLFASLFSSTIFRFFNLPWVVVLILTGIGLGPQGLNVLELNGVLEFAADTGLIFLMFMAGLETKFSSLKEFKKGIFLLSLINGAIPFLVGLAVGQFFGYPLVASMLIGIIFVSSSVAVVVPTLESTNILPTKLGRSVVSSIIIQDIASMVLLSIFLQTHQPIANLPPILYYPVLLILLVILKFSIPKIQKLLSSTIKTDLFQQEVRSLFVVLFGVVIGFELLGLHSIVAGFFAGIVLSDTVTSQMLIGKIRAIGYGIFIPIFFVVVGAKTDILVFLEAQEVILLTLAIIAGSSGSKFISGVAGAKLVGFNLQQSFFYGASSMPQLSTTLAATFVAFSFGLITNELVSALVVLSIVTTLIAPSLMTVLSHATLRSEDLQDKVVVS